jgi:hypothetical protein
LEQRRTQRYKLQLPLHIVQIGEHRLNCAGKTRDISSGGVCFLSSESVEVGGRIEYLITLSGTTPPVRIRCLGKVLRSTHPRDAQDPASDPMYEVAMTMERYQFVRPAELEALAS